jgi:LacI family transcriptional regulator
MNNRTVTIRDVAMAAGVSTATVSRVLTPGNSGRVSEKTRLRVHSVVERLEYRANYAARSLKTRSTRTIAIIAPELGNDFFMDLACGMERELDRRGYTLLIASSRNSMEEEKKRVSMLAGRMADGVVVIPAGARGEHLQVLTKRGVPIVLVDRLVEGADLDAVLSDNETGAFELTGHLLSDGFRRIAFVGGDPAISSARERLSGFTRALAGAGIRPEGAEIYLAGMGIEDGYRCMERIMGGKNLPEALVTVNLLVHLGIQRYLLEHYGKQRGGENPRNAPAGLKGPVNIPIIAGFDETCYTPFLPGCRYTAAQDAAAIGEQAAQCVLERIHLAREAGKSSAGEKGEGSVFVLREKPGNRIIRLPVHIICHEEEKYGRYNKFEDESAGKPFPGGLAENRNQAGN